MLSLPRVRLHPGFVPAAGVLAICLIAGLAGYFSARDVARSPDDRYGSAQPQYVRGVVQAVGSGRILLSTESGPVELHLAADAPVETLRPTSFDRIAAGEWLNGGAVSHAQTLFALVGIVVIPPSQLETRP